MAQSDPTAMTAALFHLACATAAACSVCATALFYLLLRAASIYRGAVNDAESALRSNVEDH